MPMCNKDERKGGKGGRELIGQTGSIVLNITVYVTRSGNESQVKDFQF